MATFIKFFYSLIGEKYIFFHMWNLFNVFSLLSNSSDSVSGYSDTLIDMLSVLSILCGISVINSKNPIVSVLFLIGLFISISVNLILLGYNFIGLSYLLVYVGAVSILFLFIIMLINVRISELSNDTGNSIPLAVFTGVLLGFPLYNLLNELNTNKEKYLTRDLNYSYNSKINNAPYSHDDVMTHLFSNISKSEKYNTNFLSSVKENEANTIETKNNFFSNLNNEVFFVSNNTWEKTL